MNRRPNFIMIVSDQQRADWLGCYGHPVLNTPNIDKLAAQGIRFDEFHTASPVCMPNRASILTGRYPSVHGLRYNGCALTSRANTFVEVLKASGYQTAAIGKSHLQPFTSNDAPFGKALEEKYNGPISEAWKDDFKPYVYEEPRQYEGTERYDFPTPYYGFDHVDMVTDHGDRAGGHYLQWLRGKTPEWEQLRDPKEQFEHDYSCPQAKRTKMPEELYPTRYIENQAVEWINEQASEEEPFFLFISFPDPHHPFNPPGKYWDRYQPEQFELDVRAEDLKTPAPLLEFARQRLEKGEYPDTPQEAFAATEQHCKEAMALTGGMIDMIDDAVGSITAALRARGLDDNTVIIYTADHGDYLGDANMLLKGPWMRKSIHRVPFIWRDPTAEPGTVTDHLGSAVDIGPTIMARAGVSPYFGIQGRDLLADVASGEGREQLLIEHNDNVPRMGLKKASRSRTLYTHDWRLTLYPGEEWGELYHTAEDPKHLNNLWFDPAAREKKGELMELLALEITATMDESPRAIRRA
ncbi:sulfatase family protein [Marinobacterium rhizophilum]|uniref:sulfatase family protein n=1 Tax=Marinobacterium rhizophilum TaxID=420402 RepID=UPI000376A298|nr:sulfatase-like hydrolase/transferase [Marinobacterium rhizophilum]